MIHSCFIRIRVTMFKYVPRVSERKGRVHVFGHQETFSTVVFDTKYFKQIDLNHNRYGLHPTAATGCL